MKTIIVIPTYNESKNIERLLQEILELNIENMSILIVDDNSPDGTAEIVKKYMGKNKKIHLLVRKTEKGRGAAEIAGFKRALEMGADVVGEMDADFSHDPKDLPKLIEACKDNEVAIGSRLIPGGKDIGRSRLRTILTKLGTLYTDILLGTKVKDSNSGFRCYRREALEKIDLNKVRSKLYELAQEMTYKVYLKGCKIIEIPITFKDRAAGMSKMSLKHILRSFFAVLKLKIAYYRKQI